MLGSAYSVLTGIGPPPKPRLTIALLKPLDRDTRPEIDEGRRAEHPHDHGRYGQRNRAPSLPPRSAVDDPREDHQDDGGDRVGVFQDEAVHVTRPDDWRHAVGAIEDRRPGQIRPEHQLEIDRAGSAASSARARLAPAPGDRCRPTPSGFIARPGAIVHAGPTGRIAHHVPDDVRDGERPEGVIRRAVALAENAGRTHASPFSLLPVPSVVVVQYAASSNTLTTGSAFARRPARGFRCRAGRTCGSSSSR